MNYLDDMQLRLYPATQDNKINGRIDFYENYSYKFSGKTIGSIPVDVRYGDFSDYTKSYDNQ